MSEEKTKNDGPTAIAQGTIFDEIGTPVACYVVQMPDGRRLRLVAQGGILRALRGKPENTGKSHEPENRDLGRYLERLPKRFHHLTTNPTVEFVLPQGGATAVGREASFFVDLCDAYADAFAAGELRPSQHKLGVAAIALLRALAKTGIEALIDEATGHQRSRAERELGRRCAAFLGTDARPWEMRFPPSLAAALAPLYGRRYYGGSYPRALQMPFAMIYDMVFGRDVANEMRHRNPNPNNVCHHQLLKEPGQRMLAAELDVVTLLAGQARNKDEFWARMRNHFLGEPLQLSCA